MRRFFLTLTLAALVAPVAPLASAQTDHSDHDMGAHSGHDMQMDGGVLAPATLNSMSGDVINVTHGPIPEIGWPAMTMDLTLLEGARIEGVAPGQEVMMILEKGADGMFAVRALTPGE